MNSSEEKRPFLRVTVVALSVMVGGGPNAMLASEAPFCRIESPGSKVVLVRPGPKDAPIDDVNWFARPVPNPQQHRIIGYASHDLNYLYDLTTGDRIRIPDKSDAVATPDGAYITVPSHYTPTQTTNFYDAAPLLERLHKGEDAADFKPAFAHHDDDMLDAYYQSVGVLSKRREGSNETAVYRMMFSGTRHPQPPGFRIVDYTVTRTTAGTHFEASVPMKLCPQIVKDMATPFISKDGRYVIAHDASIADHPPTLKIFEITGVDHENRTTACQQVLDFGFAAGKADFSFDGSKVTFHVSKSNPLIVFINGGIPAPDITDVVVVDLKRDKSGRIIGSGGLARLTTSVQEGVGNYFPAFFPDGNLLYISNDQPKQSKVDKRFHFTVVDPAPELRTANFFANSGNRALADQIGNLWRDTCDPQLTPFKENEAAWWFLSLKPDRCEALVNSAAGDAPNKKALLSACARKMDK